MKPLSHRHFTPATIAPDAVMGLERVYRRQGKFADLVTLFVEQSKHYRGTPAQSFMLYRAAEIAEFNRAAGRLNFIVRRQVVRVAFGSLRP